MGITRKGKNEHEQLGDFRNNRTGKFRCRYDTGMNTRQDHIKLPLEEDKIVGRFRTRCHVVGNEAEQQTYVPEAGNRFVFGHAGDY